MEPFKIYVQEIRIPKPGERFATNERVNAALEDLSNNNRLITSRAMLRCRIAEIWSARNKERKDFVDWARRTFPLP